MKPMKKRFHAAISREGDWLAAQCLEVNMASQRRNPEEALTTFREALELRCQGPRASVPFRLAPV